MPADPDMQLVRFREAVECLGGQRAVAGLLDVHERTVRDLVSGRRAIHTGYLQDIADQLTAHASRCRELERQLSPLYHGNRTAAQLAEKPDGRRKAPAALNGGTPGRGEWGDFHG